MRRVDSIMYYLYLVLYFVTIVFSGTKVYTLFSEQAADVLQTVYGMVFGAYFLYRLMARYKAENKIADDFVFVIVFAILNIIISNFL